MRGVCSLLAALLFVSGCGGGSSHISGEVIDTHVAGATVFADLNGNSIQDANEPAALTDSMGRFSLEGVPEGVTLYSIGGSEAFMGERRSVRFMMAAKKRGDYLLITPLSTLQVLGDPELLPRLLHCDVAAAQRDPTTSASVFLAAQQAAVLLELYEDMTPGVIASKLKSCKTLDPDMLESCMGAAAEGIELLTRMRHMDVTKMRPEHFETYEQVFRTYTQSVSEGFIPPLEGDIVNIVESDKSEALLQSWRTDNIAITWYGTVSAPPMPLGFGEL